MTRRFAILTVVLVALGSVVPTLRAWIGADDAATLLAEGRDLMAAGKPKEAAGVLARVTGDVTKDLVAKEAAVLRVHAFVQARDGQAAATAGLDLLKLWPADENWRGRVEGELASAAEVSGDVKAAADRELSLAEGALADAHRARIAATYVAWAEKLAKGEPAPDAVRPATPPDHAHAVDAWRAAINIMGDSVVTRAWWLSIARSQAAMGQPGSSANTAAALREKLKDAKDPASQALLMEALVIEAAGRLGTNDLVAARAVLQKLLAMPSFEESPFAPEAIRLLARTWDPASSADALAQSNAARRRFLKTWPDRPEAPAVCRDIAEACLVAGDLTAALPALADVISRDRAPIDDQAWARFVTGTTLRGLARFDEARAALQQFLALHPAHRNVPAAQQLLPQLLLEKGIAAMKAGKRDDAIKAYREFLDQYPLAREAPEVSLEIGRRMRSGGQFDQARDAFRDARERWRTAQPAAAAEAGLMVGVIEEEDRHDLEAAAAAFRATAADFAGTPCAVQAAARLTRLEQFELDLKSPRVFAPGEAVKVGLTVRGVKDADFRIYKLDARGYFDRKGSLGGTAAIDVALVKADQSFKFTVPNWVRYRQDRLEVALEADKKPLAEGAWLVTVEADRKRALVLVIVSRVHLVVKQAPTEVFAWATDIATGKPLADVEVLVRGANAFNVTAKTVADGTVRIPVKPENAPFEIAGASGASLVPGLSTPPPPVTPGLTPRVHWTLDRPAYRAGDTVNYAAIVRDVAAGRFTTPVDEAITVEFVDPAGRVLAIDKLKTAAFGLVDGHFGIPAEAGPGDYHVRAAFKNASYEETVAVTAYVKPEFRVRVRPESRSVRPGETVAVKVDVESLSGGIVAESPIEMRVYRKPAQFDSGRYRDAAWFYRATERTREAQPDAAWTAVKQEPAATDVQGHADLSFETVNEGGAWQYLVQVSARAAGGVRVQGSGMVYAAWTPGNVVVLPDRRAYRAGDQLTARVVTVDWSGAPLPLKGRVDVLLRRVVDGKNVEEPMVGATVDTGLAGETEVRLEVKTAGSIIVRFAGEDAKGFKVVGDSSAEVTGERPDLAKETRLISERAVWRAGQPGRFYIDVPTAPSIGLLTFEGETVLIHQIVTMTEKSGVVEVVLPELLAPNVMVTWSVPHDHHLLTSQDPIVVLRHLDVTVAPSVAVARPGDKVTMKVTTRDQAGRPVPAAIVLAATDAALDSLGGVGVQDPRFTFNRDVRPHLITTSASFAFAEARPAAALDADLVALDQRRQDYKKEGLPELRAANPAAAQDNTGFGFSFNQGLADGQTEALSFERRVERFGAEAELAEADAMTMPQGGRNLAGAVGLGRAAGGGAATYGGPTGGGGTTPGGGGGGGKRPAANPAGGAAARSMRRRSQLGNKAGEADKAPASVKALRAEKAKDGKADGDDEAWASGDDFGEAGSATALGVDNSTGLDFRSRTAEIQRAAGHSLAESLPRYDLATLSLLSANSHDVLLVDDVALPPESQPEMRSDLRDVAAWAPSLKTDASGEGSFDVTVPDNLTVWNVNAVGVDADVAVGLGTSTLSVRKDVHVTMGLPRFLSHVDSITLPVTAGQILDQATRVKITLRCDTPGVAVIEGAAEVDKELTARGALTTEMRLNAHAAGTATLQATAVGAAAGDALKRNLTVTPFGEPWRAKLEARTLVDRTTYDVDIPFAAVAGSTAASVVVQSGLAMDLLDGLAIVELHTHPGIEPLVNRVVSTALVAAAFQNAGAGTPVTVAGAAERAREFFAAVRTWQQPDGTFSFWAGHGTVPEATALVVDALARLAQTGNFAPPELVSSALTGARTLLSKGGLGRDARAWLVMALSLHGDDRSADIASLGRERDSLATASLCRLIIAASHGGRTPLAQTLLDALRARRAKDGQLMAGGVAGFAAASTDVWYGSDSEATALALLAYQAAGARTDEQADLVKHLRALVSGGRCGHGRATAMVVAALAAHVREAPLAAPGGDGDVTVMVDGKPAGAAVPINARNPRAVIALDAGAFAQGKHRVEVVRTGTGEATVRVVVSAVKPAAEVVAEGSQLAVTRSVIGFQDPDVKQPAYAEGWSSVRSENRPPYTPPPALKQVLDGQRITVRLTVKAAKDQRYVVIEDPQLAGVEMIPNSVRGGFARFERHDRRLMFFMDRMTHGQEYVITYAAWAAFPGVFTAMPAQASALYAGEINGRSASARLEVLRDPHAMNAVAAVEPTPDHRLDAGREAYAADKFEAVIAVLGDMPKKFALQEAVHMEVLHMLRVAHLRLGHHAEAVRAHTDLIERDPNPPALSAGDRARLGRAYLAVGDPERARDQAGNVLDGALHDELGLAGFLRDLGREADAASTVLATARRYPARGSVPGEEFQTAGRFLGFANPTAPPNATMPLLTMRWQEAMLEWARIGAWYPKTSLAEEATFERLKVWVQLATPERINGEAVRFRDRFPKSLHEDDVLSEQALALFALKQSAEAAPLAQQVWDRRWPDLRSPQGEPRPSPRRPQMAYLLGRIAHVAGRLGEAVKWYGDSTEPEAVLSHAFFTETALDVDSVVRVAPDVAGELPVRVKNVPVITVQIYPVDLSVLFAVRKSFSELNKADLSGIAPLHALKHTTTLEKYTAGRVGVPLPAFKAGAYLCVVAGADRTSTAVLLATDLTMEIQRTGDTARIYLVDAGGKPVAKARVSAGAAGKVWSAGETDERGMVVINVPSGTQGKLTVVAEANDRFAIGER